MRHSDSFPQRLSLRLVRATAILFISSILVIGVFSYKTIYENAIKDTSSMLENNLLEIQNVLSDVESAATSSAWVVSKSGISEEALLEYTANTIIADTNILACAVGFERFAHQSEVDFYCPTSYLGKDGSVNSMIMGSFDYDYFGMDWYIIPKLLGKPYWSEPSYDSNGSGRLVASYSKPLNDENGTFLGVLRCDIDLEWLSNKIQELKPYESSYTILAGRNASIISHQNHDMILSETLFSMAMSAGAEDIKEIASHMIAGEKGFGRFNNEGSRGFIVYSPLSNGWMGALVCSDDDVLSKAKKMNLISLLVGLIAILLLFFSNKKIVEEESSPITAIAYSALSLAQGNFKAKIPEVKSKDELKRLHDSLHYLEDSIDKYIDELKNTTTSKERYESELNIASAIQMQMLPKDYPQTPDVDLHAILHPAKEVGGDLYDFFVKDRMLYFAVGDVSGKGVPAALYMAITRSAFRFIAGLGLPVEGVVSKINNAFCDGNDSGMFVTMFVGRIDLDTLKLEYCNAGHNPILIISPDGTPRYLHAKCNLAAGLIEDFPYFGESIQLEKGSQLLIYTDGVTEAENWKQELFGEDRLENFAKKEGLSKTSAQFLDDLGQELKKFSDGNPQNDDITMMMIKL